MNDYDLIITFGIFNDCLDDILLCEKHNNKILCIVFDTIEKMPVHHLLGRDKPSLIYLRLFKKKVEKVSFITKRSTKYPFNKVEETLTLNEIETNEQYLHFIKDNRKILINYTTEYEHVVNALNLDYKNNIKKLNKYTL